MNKKIVFLLLIFVSFLANSQFSVNTEAKYMQLINNQGRKDLIEDNFYNAELASDSIILNQKQNYDNANFYYQLAVGYYTLKEYELSLFSLLRQRCLFPDMQISKQSKNLFMEAAYSNNINDSIADYLWAKSNSVSKVMSFDKRMELLLELSTKLFKKKLTSYIYYHGLLFRKISKETPYWYQHWEFLTIIKLKEKNKQQAFEQIKDVKTDVFKQVSNSKLRYKIYRKAIKHYLKTNSFRMSEKYLASYKQEHPPLMLRIDMFFKKCHIKVKKLFI